MEQDGIWLSILEFATLKKISISTIRRAVKAGKYKYKEEAGKYFIWTTQNKINISNERNELQLKVELENLKHENKSLREELNDLQMLLSVYENQRNHFSYNEILPPLPENEL